MPPVLTPSTTPPSHYVESFSSCAWIIDVTPPKRLILIWSFHNYAIGHKCLFCRFHTLGGNLATGKDYERSPPCLLISNLIHP